MDFNRIYVNFFTNLIKTIRERFSLNVLSEYSK